MAFTIATLPVSSCKPILNTVPLFNSPLSPFSSSLSKSLLPHSKWFSSTFFSSSKFAGFFLPIISSRNPSRLPIRSAVTESSRSLPLTSRAPNFELVEPSTGESRKLEDYEGYPALLVMFICNHCPFVKHLKADLVKLANEYIPKGLAVVAISANSVKTHPQDGPDLMAEEAKSLGYPFPYLYDETQTVAKAYSAACTPDFFLFKKDGRRPFELVYHGQFDDSRPRNNRPITGRDIRNAIDCVLSGRQVNTMQRPSLGCNIKWHPSH